MKALVFNMLTIAATFAAMTACTSESDPVDEINPQDGKTPIEFRSSIMSVETKAARTDNTFNEGETIGIICYVGTEVPTSNYTGAILENATFTYNQTKTKFSSSDNKAFWDRGENKKHFFYAYSPLATTSPDPTTSYVFTAGSTTDAPKVKVTCLANTGIEEDLIYAVPNPNGIEYTGASTGNVTLPFTHKLARIAFKIKKDADTPTSTLSNIEFKVNKKETTLNLITGELTAGEDLESNNKITLSKNVATTTNISTGGIDADGFSPMIVKESVISDLKITVNNKVFNVTINKQPTFDYGKITTLEIKLTATGLEFGYTMTDWETGGTDGNGEI